MSDPKNKSLMRSLGEFFGHIAHSVKTDPSTPAPTRAEVRREVVEEARETPAGKVVLRRTTIEEIELPPGTPPPPPSPPG